MYIVLYWINHADLYLYLIGHVWDNACVRRDEDDGRTCGGGNGGRRAGGEGVEVPRKTEDEVVFEENPVRGSEIERGEKTSNEREVRKESKLSSVCSINRNVTVYRLAGWVNVR